MGLGLELRLGLGLGMVGFGYSSLFLSLPYELVGRAGRMARSLARFSLIRLTASLTFNSAFFSHTGNACIQEIEQSPDLGKPGGENGKNWAAIG